MTASFLPFALRISQTRRVVWLLPDPVRTAVIETTGFVDLTIVEAGPRSMKSAPAAFTAAERSMTYWFETSL